jgi:diaminopimelate epimerase
MDTLAFYKMSASGNDFILIDDRESIVERQYKDLAYFVERVCRRRHSVGADGLILVRRSEACDFSWRFFNADGSEAEMCGNGGRCVARFAFLNGIAGESMAFETLAGVMKASIKNGNRVKLQLTSPRDISLDYPIALENRELFVNSVNTGVPHVILLTDDIEHTPVEELGRLVRYHGAFAPKGTNVDFVKVLDRKNLQIRTYERGVEGETYACGTGAVAAGVILKEKGLSEGAVNIHTRGGEILQVYVQGDEVYLEGTANVIYTAQLSAEAVE